LKDRDSKNRVLVLEDEPVIGRILYRVLKSEGYEVDVAVNGLIAREKIQADSSYNAFIFDIRTPVMNGIQLYEYLEKEYPKLTDRVIFATGDYMNATTKTFLNRVNRLFLAKPYTPAQIKENVKKIIADNLSLSKQA
jgi:DNA-binding NtrC family response regulator